MTTPRKPLASILPDAGANNDILDQFDAVEAADEFGPLPKGSYVALAVKGEKTMAKTGTPGYSVEFRVVEGEYINRRVWRTWYFTQAALKYTKRDLAKFGIDSKAKLEASFPANRMVFKLTVTVRTLDDGTEVNELKALELLRLQEPETDPYAPTSEGGEQ